MTNKKSTKRALLMSVLSLVLCVTMLMGTTFAWFTDSVTSASNVIMSGNLDIKLEYWNGTEWKDVNGSSELFDANALWEPGYTQVVYLKVSNAGTLALQYKLGVNIISETEGKTKDGAAIKLSNFIYMDAIEGVNGEKAPYADRAAAMKDATQNTLISKGYTKANTLLPVDNDDTTVSEEYVALIVHMPDTVDNAANHNGVNVPKIELGVKVEATQVGNEYDSFGNDYDAEAIEKQYNLLYTFSSDADLLAFAPTAGDAASSGLSIVDGKAQIDATGAWMAIPANLYNTNYVISYQMDITDLAVGENVTVDTGEQEKWGSTPIMLERGSTKVYYGLAKNEELGTLEGTVVDVEHTYSYKDGMLNITTVVTDGTDSITYTKAVASDGETDLYWDIYYATESGKATMDNFSVKTYAIPWNGAVDTSWYNTTDKVFSIHTPDELAGLSQLSAKGNTFSGKTVNLMENIDLNGNAWTPIKQFSGTFNGNGHEVTNFTLDGTSGRAGFIQNLGQYPATVKNLTLSNVTGKAASKQYFGILAANGHTSVLENVHVVDCKIETTNKEAWVGGIYGYFNWTSASNCTVENLEIDATGGAMFLGGFSGNMDQDLSINNVDIIGLKITVDATKGACQVGGFTGQTQTGHRQPTFNNCDVIGLDIVAKGEVQLGGFVGDAGAHTIANNCTVEGKIDASGVTDNRSFIGGFIADSGWNNNESNKGGHKLTNCSADVDIITGGSTAGGFIGSTTAYHPNDDSNLNMPITMTNCTATGTVTVANGATATIGGFAGEAERGTFKNCSTTSDTFIGKVWDGYTLNDDGNGTITVKK